MLTIGSVRLGAAPRVAVAVRDGVERAALEAALAAGAHVIEVRVDQFPFSDTNRVMAELRRFEGLPVLGTIRCAAEGGAWAGTETERAALYRAILPLVDAVDIELSAIEIRDEVIASAKAAGKLVIGSFHNFERCITPDDWTNLCAACTQCGADILKVAACCRSARDLQDMARMTLDETAPPRIVIGMGAHGAPSRVFFPALGSMLTYTFLGEATAPGQLNLRDTLQYLSCVPSE